MAEQTTTNVAPVPQRPAGLGGGITVNHWRWTWKAKNGYQETAESRGPTSEAEMRQAAQQIIDAMAATALRSGAEDPGLEIVSIEPVGKDLSPVGAFMPDNRRPLNIDQFAKPAPESAAG